MRTWERPRRWRGLFYRALSRCSFSQQGQYDCRDKFKAILALYDLNRALELDPTLDKARVWRAVVHAERHGAKNPAAAQYYAEARETAPADVALIAHQEQIYAKEYMFDEAIEAITALIALNPPNLPEIYFTRGQYHAKNDNPQAAEEDYLKAFELGYDEDRIRSALNDLSG